MDTTIPEYRGRSPFGTKLLIVMAIFSSLAVLMVVLRLYTRVKYMGRIFADDVSILISIALTFAFMAEYLVMIERGGLGWPADYISPQQQEEFLKVYYFNTITYCLTSASYKFSVLLLYSRIFTLGRFVIALKLVGAFVVCWLLVVFFTSVFLAWPINYNWEPVPGGHYTINLSVGYWGLGISNLVIDAVILLMPLPAIWKLGLSAKKKLMISTVFLLGGFVIIASVLRLVSINTLDESNIMGTTGDLSLWSDIEVNVGIISACLPTLKPLFSKSGQSKSSASFTPDNPLERRTTGPSKRTVDSDPEMMGNALSGWSGNRHARRDPYVGSLLDSRPGNDSMPSLRSPSASRPSSLSHAVDPFDSESQVSSLDLATTISSVPSAPPVHSDLQSGRRWRERTLGALHVVMTRDCYVQSVPV